MADIVVLIVLVCLLKLFSPLIVRTYTVMVQKARSVFDSYKSAKSTKSAKLTEKYRKVYKTNEISHIGVLPNTKLCPIDRVRHPAEQTEKDFYISTQARKVVVICHSVRVMYNGVKYVVIGDNEYAFNTPANVPYIRPNINVRSKECQYDLMLQEGTPVSVSASIDKIGITKRLEADQTFRIMQGSKIVVPKGSIMYQANDNQFIQFLATHDMVCNIVIEEKSEFNYDYYCTHPDHKVKTAGVCAMPKVVTVPTVSVKADPIVPTVPTVPVVSVKADPIVQIVPTVQAVQAVPIAPTVQTVQAAQAEQIVQAALDVINAELETTLTIVTKAENRAKST